MRRKCLFIWWSCTVTIYKIYLLTKRYSKHIIIWKSSMGNVVNGGVSRAILFSLSYYKVPGKNSIYPQTPSSVNNSNFGAKEVNFILSWVFIWPSCWACNDMLKHTIRLDLKNIRCFPWLSLSESHVRSLCWTFEIMFWIWPN